MTTTTLTKQEATQQIAKLLDNAAHLAATHFNDLDIYNYGRAYEYLMSKELGHSVATTRAGDDGIDESITTGPNGVEYKTRKFPGYAKSGKVRSTQYIYAGISRVDSYDEQVRIITEKILKSSAHFWAIRAECGFSLHSIYRVESKEVLSALLLKLPMEWKKKNKKDPRIAIQLTLKDVEHSIVKDLSSIC